MRRPDLGGAAALALLGVALVACSRGGDADARPVVVVSVLPYAYLVDRLAADAVRVEVLVPAGASPVTHEPGLAAMRALSSAALCLRVGHPAFPFESAWLNDMLQEMPGLRVLDGWDDVGPAADDPHVWLDPRRMERTALRLEAALADLLPDRRASLEERLAGFRREVAELDAAIRTALSGRAGRRFLVFHPAWGSFAAAYGLEQVAIERDGKEPDPHALAQRIDEARRARVKVIFVQPQFSPASAETVAREIGARLEPLDPLAYDWSANLRRAADALAAGAFE